MHAVCVTSSELICMLNGTFRTKKSNPRKRPMQADHMLAACKADPSDPGFSLGWASDEGRAQTYVIAFNWLFTYNHPFHTSKRYLPVPT